MALAGREHRHARRDEGDSQGSRLAHRLQSAGGGDERPTDGRGAHAKLVAERGVLHDEDGQRVLRHVQAPGEHTAARLHGAESGESQEARAAGECAAEQRTAVGLHPATVGGAVDGARAGAAAVQQGSHAHSVSRGRVRDIDAPEGDSVPRTAEDQLHYKQVGRATTRHSGTGSRGGGEWTTEATSAEALQHR